MGSRVALRIPRDKPSRLIPLLLPVLLVCPVLGYLRLSIEQSGVLVHNYDVMSVGMSIWGAFLIFAWQQMWERLTL